MRAALPVTDSDKPPLTGGHRMPPIVAMERPEHSATFGYVHREGAQEEIRSANVLCKLEGDRVVTRPRRIASLVQEHVQPLVHASFDL